jgi:hypothetical protein
MHKYRDVLGQFSCRPVSEGESDFSSHLFDNSSNSEEMSEREDQPIRTLQDYLQPTRTATPSCIMFPANTRQLEFKTRMIQLLATFHGIEN